MGRTEPLIVQYKNKWYDLTDFAHKHPGGKKSLTGLHNKDMKDRFERAPGHSEAAKYLMREYQITPPNSTQTTKQNGFSLNGTAKHPMTNGSVSNGVKNGVKHSSTALHSSKTTSNEDDLTHLTDESMEVRHRLE